MKEIGTEELKHIQLDMLCAIHDFCIKNGIQYSLAYGTLLGAIRHKGYIPWDDDIDIMMTRPNYERFKNAFKHDSYYFISHETDRTYPLNFAKVADSRTILIENTSLKWNCGVYIDVFCIDGVGNDIDAANKFCNRIKCIHNIYTVKNIKITPERSILRNLLLSIIKLFVSLIPYNFLLDKLIRLNTHYDYFNSHYASDLSWGDSKMIAEKTLYEEYIDVQFEDKVFSAVKDYDLFLRKAYGNYMKLPPIEKQVAHHSFEAKWKDI